MANIYKREGSPYYYADVRAGGKRTRFCTKLTNRRAAQAEAVKVEEDLTAKIEQAGKLKLRAAVDIFFTLKLTKTKSLRPTTVAAYEIAYANVLQTMGNFTLANLCPTDIDSYVKVRQAAGVSVSIRRELAFLSSVYTTVMHEDPAIKVNVPKEYSKRGLADANVRTTWLEDSEIEHVLGFCKSDRDQLFFLMAVDTGMRKQEILKLRVAEFRPAERCLVVGNLDQTRTKTGRGRKIPLTNRVFEKLQKYLMDTKADTESGHRTDWVFENPKTNKPVTDMKKPWSNICKNSGLIDVRIHDLRHTFASRGLNAGNDPLTMMSITGHSAMSSYKRYTHVSDSARELAIARLSGHKMDTVLD